MKTPAGIIYGVDDTPPPLVTAGNAVQHVGLIAILFVYPLLIFRLAEMPFSAVASLLAIGFLVLGIGTILQVARLGPVGCGFLCPATYTAAYLSPSLLAIKAGGLPLLFGMTLFAGVLEAAFSRMLDRLRPYFPTEICGLVIVIIGVSGGIAGLRLFVGAGAEPATRAEWWVAAITLGSMTAFNVWGRGLARMLCALLGLAIGYAAALAAGLLGRDVLASLEHVPWVALPSFQHNSWSFDIALVVPFTVACLAAAMKTVGAVTVCQRMVDADWVRPEMRSISRGVLADGLSTAIAGLAGSVGTNSSTASIGLASATGVASRYVAYAIGVLFIGLALAPKLAMLLAVMPRAVMVAALLFAVCFITINGLQVIGSRLLDARRSLVVGFSIIAGVAVEAFPDLADGVPESVAPLIVSPLVFSTLIALGLNLLFRIGIRRKVQLTVERDQIDSAAIEQFMQAQGAAWGARRDVIDRASFNLTQSIETIANIDVVGSVLEVEAAFDEFNLEVRVSYDGPQLDLPVKRPSSAEIIASEEGERRLAGFMLRQFADRVSATEKNGRATVLFHFDH